MKFRVTMKDPDGVYDSLNEAGAISADAFSGIDDDEREILQRTRRAKLKEFAGKWLDYCEYVTIEFDTEADTATVVSNK